MELFAYVPGITPTKHILFARPDASLALVVNQVTSPVRGLDLFSRQPVQIDRAWFNSEFRVDPELADLIVDLNLAGFRTSGCCRGKYQPDEAGHLDAAYVVFTAYLPTELTSALSAAGMGCTRFSEEVIRERPDFFRNMRSRVNAWIPDGSLPRTSLTREQIELNLRFPDILRMVFGSHVPPVSQTLYERASALQFDSISQERRWP